MLSKVFPLGTFPAYKYVVIFSRKDGRWLLSRHRARQTWETQGGHVEAGETPLMAARRELYEESGARTVDIRPVCDYWAGDRTGSAVGMVFLAEITALDPLPESEMAKVRAFDALPEALTYPGITVPLMAEMERRLELPAAERPRRALLQAYADYAPDDRTLPESTYALNGEPPEILKQYGFDAYFSGLPADGDEIALAALSFVCDHFGHNGSDGMGDDATIAGLIAFCERNGGRMNCRGLAILLASILRLKGIRARHITCKPYEEPFDDCHVVVDCLLPSGRRIMLDPTSRLYYTDAQGEPVSLRHLRELLIRGEEARPNPDASYNGGPFDAAENWAYMIKNTFRFARGFDFFDGADDERLELIPANDVDRQPRGCDLTTDEQSFWKI